MTLAQRFLNLKTRVAGNRQELGYMHTYVHPVKEQVKVTELYGKRRRIIGELEFAVHLCEANGDKYDGIVNAALEYLEAAISRDGALTDAVCDAAEELLLPLESVAKEYTAILIAHAHIDMNWQWGYDETVAITLATFRTMLNIMNEYPDFHFSQSQASVYKIVEEHDPEMMKEIKARIAEGRWEVTAAAWVETDKNMPSSESLIRHIEQSREYLKNVWGVKNFDIDFSPDTFGHNINVPEINTFGGVKYYYHCRGIKTNELLYRYRAPSGSEITVFCEPIWYNAGITEKIGATIVKISQCCSGIKTLPMLYGVGDHGGGPSRRDIERGLEMMEWKIFPTLRFGTLLDFFKETDSLRDVLPVVDKELNTVFPGCYTTQSRIKRGNRRLESLLYSAESISTLATALTDFKFDKPRLDGAWQNVLFNHFHDIITGSCVAETREYAMALYQRANAEAGTQIQNATRKIGLAIDTSGIDADLEDDMLSEGAGIGYGIKNFIGVPNPERGIGKTRIFHIFNTLPYPRTELAELTVWEWMGDISRIEIQDKDSKVLPHQMIDTELQKYWGHRFIRLLCQVSVPALGYTTVVLREKELESYPVYFDTRDPRLASPFDGILLENEYLRAVIDPSSGRISSMVDKEAGNELLSESAGFTFIETECNTSDAWHIGRPVRELKVDRCLELKKTTDGDLTRSVKAVYGVQGSKITAVYSLDKGSRVIKVSADIDWRHHGNDNDVIPVLDYRVPLAVGADKYLYGVPMGNIERNAVANDVPAVKYAMAGRLILMSDCKYGYRGNGDSLSLTLINSSTRPDRYPEIGVQTVNIYVGACDKAEAERLSQKTDTALVIQPSNVHGGTLPLESSLLFADGDNVTVSAVIPFDGGMRVRFYETEGKSAPVKLKLNKETVGAECIDLCGNKTADATLTEYGVVVTSKPYSVTEVKIYEK